MTEKFFVDTNVLLYLYDLDEPAKRSIAAAMIDRLWGEGSCRTSAQVLNELFVNLTGKLKPRMSTDQAWDIVCGLLAWNPHPVDRDLLLRARDVERRYRINWWDSLIVAAAQAQDCSVLLTEDLQPGMRFDQVTVLNPFRSEVRESRATYAFELRSRHAQPGRPCMQAA